MPHATHAAHKPNAFGLRRAQVIAILAAAGVIGVGGSLAFATFTPATLADAARSAVWGVGPVLIAGLLASILAASIARQGLTHIPTALMAGAATRMMGSLLLAVGAYILIRPDRLPFWGAFLIASLSALALETMFTLRGPSVNPGRPGAGEATHPEPPRC